LPKDVSAFELDSLDKTPVSGCTFIVKRSTDRPDQFRVHVRTIEESGV